MTNERLNNGVRVRRDGKGDGWANEHRTALGNEFLMQDCDGIFGQLTFASQSANRLFLEYVPDGFEHRLDMTREMAVVAMFDRKGSLEKAFQEDNLMWLHLYLSICRKLSKFQPVPVRFFVVSGPDAAPWDITEVNTSTRERGRSHVIQSNQMMDVWRMLGLAKARQDLKRWMQDGGSEQMRDSSRAS